MIKQQWYDKNYILHGCFLFQTNESTFTWTSQNAPSFVRLCMRTSWRSRQPRCFLFYNTGKPSNENAKEKASLLPLVSKLPILFRALSRSWFIWRACRGGGLRRYQSLWLVLSIKRSNLCKTDRAANPPRYREGLIDDVITYDTWRHLRKKYSLTPIITNLRWHKTREKDVVGIITFKLIGFLPTNHIIACITMTSRRLWENLLF